jgi:hypothetical protein
VTPAEYVQDTAIPIAKSAFSFGKLIGPLVLGLCVVVALIPSDLTLGQALDWNPDKEREGGARGAGGRKGAAELATGADSADDALTLDQVGGTPGRTGK